MTCIGLDVGHSAVKMAWRGKNGKIKRKIFPSVAVPAMTITDNEASDQAKKETVTVNGLEYFFGETAVHEVGSIAVTGLHDRWLEMPEFQALVQGAINIVKDDTGVIHSVTAGLPPSIFSDQNLKLRNIISLCTNAEVRVHQEPAGVAMQNRLDESGIMIPDSTGDLGVVAIGRYTTDFMAMLDGRWVQGAAGSARGMSRAANLVMRKLNEQGYKIDYLDADDALWKKSIKYNGANNDVTPVVEIALHVLASEIFDATSARFGDTGRKMEKILVAGGGAGLMFDGLKKYWPQAVLVEDPRFAVAEGFRRAGEGLWNIRNK